MAVAESCGTAPALLARLKLSPAKLAALASGARTIAALPEPLGRVQQRTELADGLVLTKCSAPLGVLLVIFESRPDALPQIAALCLRAGDALILKGGKEAAKSNAALHSVVVAACEGVLGEVHGRSVVSSVTSRGAIDDLLSTTARVRFAHWCIYSG